MTCETDREALDHWSGSVSWLESNGVSIQPELRNHAERIVSDLQVFQGPVNAKTLGSAWRSTQSQTRRDPVAWLAVLSAFRLALRFHGQALDAGLRLSGLRWSRTLLEVESRLAGQLLALVRKTPGLVADDVAALSAALALFQEVEPRVAAMSPKAQRGIHGQHGITALLLARRMDADENLLEQAQEAFERSELAGDTTPGHFAYLIEIHLRRYRHTRMPAQLDAAAAVWDRSPEVEHRDLLANGTQLRELQAQRLRSEDVDAYWLLLVDAEQLASRGIAIALDLGHVDGFLHAVRARLRRDLYRVDLTRDGHRRREWLHRAEDDGAVPEAAEHLDPEWLLDLATDLARLLQRNDEHEQAAQLLEAARRELNPNQSTDAAARWRSAVLDSAIFTGLADGVVRQQFVAWVEEGLTLPDSVRLPAAAMSVALRVLARDDPDSDLMEAALARLRAEASDSHERAFQHVMGHVGRLEWIRSRTGAVVVASQAAEAFDSAIGGEPGRASAILLADAGRAWLQVARVQADGDIDESPLEREALERAALLLDQSLIRLETTGREVGDNYDPVIVTSRAGEAYARLHSYTRADAHLDRAISLLERTLKENHPWPALPGHLGDVYFRRGIARGDIIDLDRAIELKQNGDPVRENRSVLAAAYTGRYESTRGQGDLVAAADFAHQAIDADTTWPWPHLQLAAIAEKADASDFDLALEPADSYRHRAAKLAVEITEFGSRSLGGQERGGRSVYVLRDRHQLLERALVLKRLKSEMALQEQTATNEFGAYLSRTSSDPTWAVPRSVGLIPQRDQDDKAVFVMQRLAGPTLADVARDASDPGQLLGHLDNVARFLAAYQAWRREADQRRRSPQIGVLTKKLKGRARGLGLSDSEATSVVENVADAMRDTSIVAVAKRDAHGGNWILSNGKLVAIDLEATSVVPLLWELVMLAYDHPFISPDDAGWRNLEDLAANHLSELRDRGVPTQVDSDTLTRTLCWFAVAHILAGTARVLHETTSGAQSAADQAYALRRIRHGASSLGYIASGLVGAERELLSKLQDGVTAKAEELDKQLRRPAHGIGA